VVRSGTHHLGNGRDVTLLCGPTPLKIKSKGGVREQHCVQKGKRTRRHRCINGEGVCQGAPAVRAGREKSTIEGGRNKKKDDELIYFFTNFFELLPATYAKW